MSNKRILLFIKGAIFTAYILTLILVLSVATNIGLWQTILLGLIVVIVMLISLFGYWLVESNFENEGGNEGLTSFGSDLVSFGLQTLIVSIALVIVITFL